MTVNDIAQHLEALAPLTHAEDFDNVGLLVGNPTMSVTGVLVTLDTLENVIDEALEKQCNMIVSFHPIIFKNLSQLTGSTYVERVVIKAITHNIAIYSMHTALDNSPLGVNYKICEVLGITNPTILIPKLKTLKKLTTYIPFSSLDKTKKALYEAGANHIDNRSHYSFNIEGTGLFESEEDTPSHLASTNAVRQEKKAQLNVVYSFERENNIIHALRKIHPYQEIVYEVMTLDNPNPNLGMGMIGTLEKAMEETVFLRNVKAKMHASVVRHSQLLGKKVKRIAVLGGSGAFAIHAAKKARADILITADLKYHQFFEAERQLVLVDIGHFETEQFTKDLLVEYLTKKMPSFVVSLSESITNPIKYL